MIHRLAFLCLLLTAASRAGDAITLPATGLLDLDEGTIEAWVRIDVDPKSVAVNFAVVADLFVLTAPNGLRIDIRPAVWQQRAVTRVGFRVDDVEPRGSPIWGRHPGTPAVWHHIALCWRDRSVFTWYLNGKATGSLRLPSELHRALPPGATIRIGASLGFPVYLDDFRISNVARRPETMAAAEPLVHDAATALLLTFDAPPSVAIPTLQELLVLPESWHSAEGKYGKGVVIGGKAPAKPL